MSFGVMTSLTLRLSPKKFSRKPSKKQAGILCSQINSLRNVCVPLAGLVEAIKQGQTFTQAAFKGNQRSINGWEQQRLFCADVDEANLSYDEVLSMGSTLPGLEPSVIYESFSSTSEKRKWRVMYVAEDPVYDPEVARTICKGITSLFSGIDAGVTKDISRLFYGCREDQVHSVRCSRFDPDSLLQSNEFKLLLAKKSKSSKKQNPKKDSDGSYITKGVYTDTSGLSPRRARLHYKTKARGMIGDVYAGSGYMSVRNTIIMLVYSSLFDEEEIADIVYAAVDDSPHYADWQHDPELILDSVIPWALANPPST